MRKFLASRAFLGLEKVLTMDETTSGRSWFQLAYRWLMPVALVAAISVAAVTVISAGSDRGGQGESQRWSEGTEDGEQDGDCDHDGKRSTGWTRIAELVGTDPDGLKTALGEGQTLAEIAESNDVEPQTVIDGLVADANDRIDEWVEAGKLTEEEAVTRKSEAAMKIETLVNDGFKKENLRGWGKGRWRGHGHGLGGNVETN